jgi:hypothetical protein
MSPSALVVLKLPKKSQALGMVADLAALYNRQVMPMNDLLGCVHPLLVDGDTISEFPYWNIGTGFLIRFEGNVYLVTAKHCLQNHKAEPEQISIPVGSGSDEFILFDRIYRGDAEGAEDNDFADYVIMRAKAGSISEAHTSALNAFNLAAHSVILPENPKVKNLWIRGYPRVLNAIDYENKHISRKSFTFDGTYIGPSGSKHCHTLEYTPHPEVDDPDQLSGSPVFGLIPAGMESTAKLAGMVISGGKGSQFCQFISAQVLWSALNEALRQESRLTGEKSDGPA